MTSVRESPGESPRPPRYVTAVIGDFAHAADDDRHHHLGHWDDPDNAVPGSRAHAQDRMVEVLVELVGVGPADVVLDVGCGFGGTLAWLSRAGLGSTLLGLDVDIRQLRNDLPLGRTLPREPSWIQGDGARLPVVAASIDRALAIEVLWHLPSRADFFAEMARVLRPGGRVALVDLLLEPGAADHLGVSEDTLAATLREGFDPWPEVHATLDDVLGSAERSGLSLVAHRDATAATAPTYLDHGDAARRPGAASLSGSASVACFVQLQRAGMLRVHYVALEVPR
ncbi:MAG: class I SAM-dependent methyltransferase [Acidimicrobiales bacterium]